MSPMFSTLCFETVSHLTWSLPIWLDFQASEFQETNLLVLELRDYRYQAFNMGAGDMNSGRLTFMSNTLSTEQSCQPTLEVETRLQVTPCAWDCQV